MVGADDRYGAILVSSVVLMLLIFMEKFGFGSPRSLAMRARVLGEAGRLGDYINALSTEAKRVVQSFTLPTQIDLTANAGQRPSLIGKQAKTKSPAPSRCV